MRKLAKFLCGESCNEKDTIDIVEYSLRVILQQVLQISTLVLAGIVLHVELYLFVVVISFFVFRANIFKRMRHFKSLKFCWIATTIIMVIPAIIFEGNLIMCAISGVVLAFITSDMPKRK